MMATIHNIQIVAESTDFSEEFLKPITTGACINNGKLVESLGKGQNVEIHAEAIEIYGTADPEAYPRRKSLLRILREIAHLRPRTNTRRVLRVTILW